MKSVTVLGQARSIASCLRKGGDTYHHLFCQILHLALFNFLLLHLVLHGDGLTLFWPEACWH